MISYQSLNTLRPMTSCLTTRDYLLLQNCAEEGLDNSLLQSIVEMKIADAQVVFPDEIEGHIATEGSRIVYLVNGRRETTTLVHGASENAARTLSVMSFLGIALIGMAERDGAAFVTEEGALGHVSLRHVLFQPEAHRRTH